MNSHYVDQLWFSVLAIVAAVLVISVLTLLLVSSLIKQRRYPAAAALVAIVALTLVLVLSGCGTAPLPGPTRLQVPAELLIPPGKPVPLHLASPLRPPGPTTLKTPRAVPLTGSGTSI